MTNPDLIDGRYEVLQTLGKGSFGQTLLARDASSDQRVAIKALHADKAANLKTFEMFEREATVLGNLRHQGIPAVLDSFHARWQGSETAFLVLEYMEGPTLEQLIEQQHSFDSQDVLALVLDLASILEYLHERVPPILHRDIKPANVILRHGRTPVLVDFGAVRNVFRAPDETGSTVVGTYGYMPYEQYMGQATPASDLYALGATMLHLLTGRPPSEFLSDQGRLDVPNHLPGGDRVRDVLSRLLAPAAADRFQSAADLRRALLLPTAEARSDLPVARTIPLPTEQLSRDLLGSLPPAPRALEGKTAEIFRKNAPTAWSLMGNITRPGARPGAATIALFGFLSVISMGVLPLIFGLISAARRKHMKPFFIDGQTALGLVQSIGPTSSPTGERTVRVAYEFEADGHIRRGADQVSPRAADKLRDGDTIPVLYLPDRDYDSIAVST